MTEREPFRMQIKVRLYELDPLGHLNHAVYHSYAEVARLEAFERAARGSKALEEQKIAAVLLASNISYRREIRRGETVEVTCDVKFGTGKTFQMEQQIVKLDGTLSAELLVTVGLMDLERRKLVDDPRGRFERAGFDLKLLSTSE
ncbi:acyl-CoA thioester hydrolase [Amycolatopsis bartoniae]|uniref:Thioesterase n=1 Tax=Amycolatopsis bartoniae TaxID=941986 RepID=A0A8H9MET6_9PSEU|nr:acyl-CoA thioesterase [Amycolatopsis bartoniae]MBB2938793.1 acyl-CoA thioester hydrolase [Amycolatopsis bartoniae]TVS99162.1 acyl-CoA thioesterase [Amycolatopsis bartoniae]GHF80204.1 thioesterase [Amycolatopsis bartoniae]